VDRIVDVSALVTRIAETTRVIVGDKPVSVVMSVPSLPVMVTTDPVILCRIILNLAKNAVRFTQQGTITIALQVIGNTLEVVVTDTGGGFRPNRLADYTTAMERFGNAGSGDDAGPGPCLVASSDLARLINGSLTERSKYGRGAMFTLTLPLRCAERRGGLYAVE
jgi:signal transduction histidine kinase